jgi:hypothetical protein
MSPRLARALTRLVRFRRQHAEVMEFAIFTGDPNAVFIAELMRDAHERRN